MSLTPPDARPIPPWEGQATRETSGTLLRLTRDPLVAEAITIPEWWEQCRLIDARAFVISPDPYLGHDLGHDVGYPPDPPGKVP